MPAGDEFHKYEVVDRAHLFVEMFSAHVVDHPVVQADPELKEDAESLALALALFYQHAGRKFL